ncbi:hypothetical protein [Olivibacter sp. LS-1]|nr:hypothetical protein [Olivibacter sp. LS-1]
MNSIITTTTDTLDRYTIEEYHEPVTANLVVDSIMCPYILSL